jgi:hypothetical protein
VVGWLSGKICLLLNEPPPLGMQVVGLTAATRLVETHYGVRLPPPRHLMSPLLFRPATNSPCPPGMLHRTAPQSSNRIDSHRDTARLASAFSLVGSNARDCRCLFFIPTFPLLLARHGQSRRSARGCRWFILVPCINRSTSPHQESLGSLVYIRISQWQRFISNFQLAKHDFVPGYVTNKFVPD